MEPHLLGQHMSELLTVELPDELARRAHEVAAASNRRIEDAAVAWIRQAIGEPLVESLPDCEVIALCDAVLDDDRQDDLSRLLALQREGALPPGERPRLEQLMADYRRGMVVKARAWKEAVARGLRPSLEYDAA